MSDTKLFFIYDQHFFSLSIFPYFFTSNYRFWFVLFLFHSLHHSASVVDIWFEFFSESFSWFFWEYFVHVSAFKYVHIPNWASNLCPVPVHSHRMVWKGISHKMNFPILMWSTVFVEYVLFRSRYRCEAANNFKSLNFYLSPVASTLETNRYSLLLLKTLTKTKIWRKINNKLRWSIANLDYFDFDETQN